MSLMPLSQTQTYRIPAVVKYVRTIYFTLFTLIVHPNIQAYNKPVYFLVLGPSPNESSGLCQENHIQSANQCIIGGIYNLLWLPKKGKKD